MPTPLDALTPLQIVSATYGTLAIVAAFVALGVLFLKGK